MELTVAEKEIDDIGNCRNENWRTFFQEPGWDRIRVRLLVGTTEKDLWNFRFRCRPKSEEIRRWR